jgi:hypothetical protein
MVFYILCETVNKNQFVLNFVVCIVLLAMDFWTVGSSCSKRTRHPHSSSVACRRSIPTTAAIAH